jgi:hypothetical protein
MLTLPGSRGRNSSTLLVRVLLNWRVTGAGWLDLDRATAGRAAEDWHG